MKILKVEFRSQLDNLFNPYGSCNVTSIAMALNYHGIIGTGLGQLEDQLYKEMENRRWSRHNPYDLVKICELKKIADKFTSVGNILDIKESIDNNKPTVLHGYFTRSGHIIECHGYDGDTFICHDPYGSYLDGYCNSPNLGRDVRYSRKLIEEVCMPDGNLWIHSIGNR